MGQNLDFGHFLLARILAPSASMRTFPIARQEASKVHPLAVPELRVHLPKRRTGSPGSLVFLSFVVVGREAPKVHPFSFSGIESALIRIRQCNSPGLLDNNPCTRAI